MPVNRTPAPVVRRPGVPFAIAVVALLVGACASPAATTFAPSSTGSQSVASPATGEPSEATTATPAPTAARPTPAPTEGPVTIYYATQSQVELSAGGPRVLIDVSDPAALSRPATADDVLLITHGHSDHFDPGFFKAFPGTKVLEKAGTLTQAGTTITGIAAAHTEGDPITSDGSTDYIYVVDLAGLRIVHFGDLGQSQLTADQMAAIGKVDVAFSQLNNPYSEVDDVNKRGFMAMAQVKPRLLILTHLSGSSDTAQLAAKTWKATYTAKPSIIVSASTLPSVTTVLFMADNAGYGPQLKLQPASW